MTKTLLRAFSLAIAAAAATLASAPALACACCAQQAHRYVAVESVKTRHTAEFEKLRFAGSATLATRGDTRVRGVSDPAETYSVEVARMQDRFTFALKDDKGRTGTLGFRLPNTIAIFEVDPRDGGEKREPVLYKEWKVIAFTTSGDGMFKGSVTRNTKITLVLHGRGNACTSADQFTGWTLQVYGPAAGFTLYGALMPAAR